MTIQPKSVRGRVRSDYLSEAAFFRDADSPVALVRVRHGAMRRHAHAFAELALVTGGEAWHTAGGGGRWVQAGDYFLIPAGRYHAYERTDGIELINILIRDCFFRRHGAALGKMKNGWRFGGPAAYSARPLESDAWSEALVLVGRIEEQIRRLSDGFAVMQEALLLELLILLGRWRAGRPARTDRLRDRIGRVLHEMDTHYAKPLAIPDLARRAGMSPRSFLRHFRGAVGLTPGSYLQRLRVSRACGLLRSTDQTAAEVGAACGLADPAYFGRIFRRATGVAPGAYRRRFRE